MDHEFGSSQLTESQVGWDWFSVQLTNNYELMLYHMRRKDGSIDPHSSGTLIRPDGTSVHLRRDDVQVQSHTQWKSPKSGAVYPQRWTLRIPTVDLILHLEPVLAEQELVTDNSTRVTYWEGSVTVSGSMQGQAIDGVGYVELTGYVQRVNLEQRKVYSRFGTAGGMSCQQSLFSRMTGYETKRTIRSTCSGLGYRYFQAPSGIRH